MTRVIPDSGMNPRPKPYTALNALASPYIRSDKVISPFALREVERRCFKDVNITVCEHYMCAVEYLKFVKNTYHEFVCDLIVYDHPAMPDVQLIHPFMIQNMHKDAPSLERLLPVFGWRNNPHYTAQFVIYYPQYLCMVYR